MNNHLALNPHRSIVVEACAGSGKTWLLVSRIIRLLLDGVPPGEILAITFTRKAAQEMQVRLREWLYELASGDDEHVRRFLRERAVADLDLERLLPSARSLYRQFMLAQPAVTISTFHGWFMQILQRAPLNAGMAGGVQLVEQTSALRREAWQMLLDKLHIDPALPEAQAMLALFAELGLANTERLLSAFLDKRSEWWAYTGGQRDPLAFALEDLRVELRVDLNSDPLAELFAGDDFADDLHAFAALLYGGSAAQGKLGAELEQCLNVADDKARFNALWPLLFTQKDTPKPRPNKGQDESRFLALRSALCEPLQQVRAMLAAQGIYRMNRHALRCGAALLAIYQELKQRQQLVDFGDLEWRVSELLTDSDHAEYLQYKLDSRYRHVLLDEFQDTNPLQWQILQAWFAASAAVQSTPTVFVVGDPKQSIYRFRRADARLFGVVREFLQQHYAALHLTQNETRRNAPAVLAVVNGVFGGLPEFADFETHIAHQQTLPGHVEVMPLAELLPSPAGGRGVGGEGSHEELNLRNPLTEPYPDQEEGAREQEAAQFAAKISSIVGQWQVQEKEQMRPAQFSDIMVLVRRRTHLKAYEQALRSRHIPYLTSRRGGLLDTLEALDIQALLTFLITPFADLQLAHALRTPIFSCSDDDLILLAIQIPPSPPFSKGGENGVGDGSLVPPFEKGGLGGICSWWPRLQHTVATGTASPHLQRAYYLLQSWLQLADTLPVHDLLDRIYFEGDVQNRYAAAVPDAMCATVKANLQAFMEIALNVDAGRYPSLPGFLRELAELRRARDDEAPDEGKVSQAGNALRIYTVHEAKGLEAPIVWLLDANQARKREEGCDVLLHWPTGAVRPTHFSLYGDKASRGPAREHYFAQDAQLAQREDLNLLYVAMTRAKQVLMVSGNGECIEGSWYDRIAHSEDRGQGTEGRGFVAVTRQFKNKDVEKLHNTLSSVPCSLPSVDDRLTQPLSAGSRKAAMSDAQRYGIWLHSLMQQLAPPNVVNDAQTLQRQLGIPAALMPLLWQQAQQLLAAPNLSRFFSAQHYRAACNEMPYVNARGELRRIDRLVEFDDEVWVLDYKTGETANPAPYRAQLAEYRSAMQAIYPHKTVHSALIFGDGQLLES